MRREHNILARAFLATAFIAWLAATGIALTAGSSTPLDVAYAGSMGAVMNGGVRIGAAKALGVELRGRAQGSMGLARLIQAGSIRPDVFISVTPGPMQVVLDAHKAAKAVPIARTEVVIAYSSRSRFAKQFAASGKPGGRQWWRSSRPAASASAAPTRSSIHSASISYSS